MTWRPREWVNPHPYPVYVEADKNLERHLNRRHKDFEAGADEILKLLRRDGMPTSLFLPNICELFDLASHPDVKRQMIIERAGKVVFIPEEGRDDIQD